MPHSEKTNMRFLEFSPATEAQIRAAFDLLHTRIPEHSNLTPTDELLDEISHSYMNPLNGLDKISLSKLNAEYDTDTNTSYPDVITLQAHIFYGEMPLAERTLMYVLAHEQLDDKYSGFVLQAFHDSESYSLEAEHSIAEFARTIAAHQDEYTDTVVYDQQHAPVTSYRQTAELRPLDEADLELLAIAAQRVVPQ